MERKNTPRVRSYTLKSTAIMTLVDLFFNAVLIYAWGLLVGLIPSHTEQYLRFAVICFLLKTVVWLGMRIPLMRPIDRWLERGSPPDDNEPALIRAIYYFPFDFTLVYGAILGLYYAGMMMWLVWGPGPLRVEQELLMPGLIFSGAIAAGVIAVGVPLNLILTAKFSTRLAERPLKRFRDTPGRALSLKTKMVTIALALGCAPSLLLFSVQRFMQIDGLYQEADRMAVVVSERLASEAPFNYSRWALNSRTYPFLQQEGELRFFGVDDPPEAGRRFVEKALAEGSGQGSWQHRKERFVLRINPGSGRQSGVLVGVPEPRGNWLALSLVLMLASIWPLVTALLMERTIAKPLSTISNIFHRITGRGRAEETDRVPIFYKDEVGRLAFNANRTLDTLAQAQEQLQRTASRLGEKNRELEEAYRTKGEFLANMSHELRTPLNAIIGFSRLMKRKLKDDLPPRQKKNLNLIQQSGEQLLVLVNDLLDFEKIEAGKLTIKREQVVFKDFMENLETTLRPLAEEKEMSLVFDTGDAPEWLITDKERLRQILTNLVTNSIKYSDEGEVRVTTSTSENRLGIVVKDQGIGMTADQVDKIFDPFHQVDSSRTRERGGVGLGLAIVARLVKMLRGTIEVSSVPGEGSTFELSLPLVDDISHLKPTGGGAQVLVVDDNLDYLEATYTELTEAGYRVTVANSGALALELLEEFEPSVILLDIVMPEMDGWEVLKRLKEQESRSHIPVVITSVVDDKPVGLDVEIAGWLSKPFEFEELKQYLVREQAAGSDLEGGLVIVEDDPQTAELLAQTFQESGFVPEIFATESQARKVLQERLPAVLILDLHLQEGSGWSVLTYLRSLPEGEKTQVFIYTASDLSKEERERLGESFVTVVTKHGQDSLSELVNSIVG